MPRMHETPALRFARELRELTSRMRGLNVRTQEEADALQSAIASLQVNALVVIRINKDLTVDA